MGNSDVEKARIFGNEQRHGTYADRAASGHRLTPEAYCQEIGLNWMAALDLAKQDFFSFDPKSLQSLNAVQAAEMKFLGRLVAGGCCGSILHTLLAGLQKPYAYNLERMYYDWIERRWRLLEDTEGIESRYEDWLKELVEWGDEFLLERVRAFAEQALEDLRARQSAGDNRVHSNYFRRAGTGL